uniref:CSON010509 protein n=1 Tax=Culicoides sonorensis TaxID=179676 RepID=A0A336KHF0_CULSO
MYMLSKKTSKKIVILLSILMQLVCYHCVSSSNTIKNAISMNCSLVKNDFKSRLAGLEQIPETPLKGISLRFCDNTQLSSCCSQSMEMKLVNIANSQLENYTKELIQKLATILKLRAQKFNENFKDLLNASKIEFHDMFKRTYGVIYEQNAHVFSDMFNELEGYYAHGKVDLIEAMDSFFNILYQKMFTVINMQYQFDDKYLGCVGEHMKSLKPFGDVPDKFSLTLKRSLVATRTYAQALKTAADITKNLQHVRTTPECVSAVASMSVCGLCVGKVEKPCSAFCINVMKSCFESSFSDLSLEWDNFVSAMEKLSERLLGSFNIVVVVEPINIKISEAIMNFQDSGLEITNKIFQECGKPKLQGSFSKTRRSVVLSNFTTLEKKNTRIRRAAKQDGRHHESLITLENNGRKNRKKNKNKRPQYPEHAEEPIIDRLIKDIRQKVKDSKKFWSNLAFQMCNNENIIASSNENKCWTGQLDFIRQSISSSTNKNTQVEQQVANSRYSSVISHQLYKLRNVNNQLKNAFNGMDVAWSDQDESGSGSGEGENNEYGSGFGLIIDSVDPQLQEKNKENNRDETFSKDYTEEPKIQTEPTHINPIRPIPSSTEPVPKHAGSAPSSEISPIKALLMYLLPICIAWFGGLMSDLL